MNPSSTSHSQKTTEPIWLVKRTGKSAEPLFKITLGPIEGDLPEEWVDVHENLLQLAGEPRAMESEADTAARRQRLLARCNDSEQYAYATYLKWDCALELQHALPDFRSLVEWSSKPARDAGEAISLLRLEDLASRSVVGLLLLRWGWAGSLIFEFLNVRADVKDRMTCQPAAALVYAGLDLAQRLGRSVAWVETGPLSEKHLWNLLFTEQLQEIRHSNVTAAMKNVSRALSERSLALLASET